MRSSLPSHSASAGAARRWSMSSCSACRATPSSGCSPVLQARWRMLRRGSARRHWPSSSPLAGFRRTKDGAIRCRSRFSPLAVRGMPPLATTSMPCVSRSSWCGSMPCVAHCATLARVRASRTDTQPWPELRSVSVVYSHCPSLLAMMWPSKLRAGVSWSSQCCCTSLPCASRRISQRPGRLAMARKPPPASATRPCARPCTGVAWAMRTWPAAQSRCNTPT